MVGDRRPIGIFDSGIGGLTVLTEIAGRLPAEALIYLGDTARVPYGTKSQKTIRRYAIQDTLFLLERGVKAVVVACNTASSLALNELTRYFDIPIIDVVKPGAIAAVRRTSGHVGIIGTKATIASGSYERAIREQNPTVTISTQACPMFVPLVEEGMIEGQIAEAMVDHYLEKLIAGGVDTLILGCTHYPLLGPMIRRRFPSLVLINSGAEAAAMAEAVLTDRQLLNRSEASGSRTYYVTDLSSTTERVAREWLSDSSVKLQLVSLDEAF